MLSIASSVAAVAQCDYRYAATGLQGPTPGPGLGPGMVQITNTVASTAAPSVVLGLAQAYGIDGGSSGSAQPLATQQPVRRGRERAQQGTFTAGPALYTSSGAISRCWVGRKRQPAKR